MIAGQLWTSERVRPAGGRNHSDTPTWIGRPLMVGAGPIGAGLANPPTWSGARDAALKQTVPTRVAGRAGRVGEIGTVARFTVPEFTAALPRAAIRSLKATVAASRPAGS